MNGVHWKVGARALDLTHDGLVMGIVNATPDSFSDGGRFLLPVNALGHALELEAEGADIIDIGGESTRPGSVPVNAEQEFARVIPVVEAFVRKRKCPATLVSVDTSKASVAEAALKTGADIINDVTGLRGDPDMLRVLAESGCGIVVMHMRGDPRTMQQGPVYKDIVGEVRGFFEERLAVCVEAGMAPERLCFDPGIGFGKTLEHNLALLRGLGELHVGGRPILLGVSRKSFIGAVLGDPAMEAREWPTVALTAYARQRGVKIVRVHDVRPNREALRMAEAILAVP
jgi:dihydropteroate synthase